MRRTSPNCAVHRTWSHLPGRGNRQVLQWLASPAYSFRAAQIARAEPAGQRPRVRRLSPRPERCGFDRRCPSSGGELLTGTRRCEGIARAGRILRRADQLQIRRLLVSRAVREPAQPRQGPYPLSLHTWTQGCHLHPQVSEPIVVFVLLAAFAGQHTVSGYTPR